MQSVTAPFVCDRGCRRSVTATGKLSLAAGRLFSRWLRPIGFAFGCALAIAFSGNAEAATCSTATSAGTAPADWATYCWLDFSAYNDATARSAGGQSFAFVLNDGSTLSLIATVTSAAGTALKSVAAPAWAGAAVGNTAFLGVPGKPILYTATNKSTVTIVFSSITLAPPPGVTGGSIYSFVAADGESTNTNESLSFTTNGGNWSVLDQVQPISGSNYPTTSNTGATFTETGAAGTVGSYIVGSINATQVTTVLVAGGLQGAMFALRFSTISLNKILVGGRANAADQFTYRISATASGTTLGTGSSSGAGNGPYAQTSSFLTTPQSLTLGEAMAAGSVSTLASYSPSLSCTNSASGSPTVLPNNAATSSYVIPSIAFGDAIACVFTNTKNVPLLSVAKSAPTPTLQVGVSSVYTLTVTNSGTSAATTAQVKDQLPANLTFVSATGTNWSCGSVGSLITCNFSAGTIAIGGTSTIAVTVSSPVAAGGASDTNYASIDPSGGSTAPTPGASCNPAASCTSVGPTTVIYINPAADGGTVTAGTASTAIANVASNDTISGVAATLGGAGNAAISQSGSWPSGIALNWASGAITTGGAVPPGVYSVVYQLCDRNTPANCATASDTVTVIARILPLTDSGSATAGTAATPIANVVTNDTVNGAAAILGAGGNATVAQSGSWTVGISLNTTTGAVTTTAAVAPGTYTVAYQLCDKNTPVNCATVSDMVTVAASIVPTVDIGSSVAGIASVSIANIAANDTVNGAAATLGAAGNSTVAKSGAWPAGLSLNTATGAISTTAAVAPGSYNISYQLCDTNTPANCATVVDTITVTASITPTADSGSAVAGSASTAIVNVAANDSVNGSAATLGASGNSAIAESGSWPAGIALNTATGAVTTAAAVPPGLYSVAYQLCDRNTPANCATATDSVTVTGAIAPNPESGSATAGTASTPIANVVSNDSVNGAAATLGASGNATISEVGSWPGGVALNVATGAITTTAAAVPAIVNVQYKLCDRSTPANCATTTDVVTISAAINAVADSGTSTAGAAATPITNIAANDSVNGTAAVLGAAGNATVAQSGSWPAGITLNLATGAVTSAASVPPGIYSFAYRLCDRNSPANCATVVDQLSVAASIVAIAGSGTAITGIASTPIANAVATDSVNGASASLGVAGNATVSQSGSWPAGITLNSSSGAITTTTAVASGIYAVSYQLCDRNTPVNCATAIDTITVHPGVVAAPVSGSSVAGIAATPIADIVVFGSVGGLPATLGPTGNATVAKSGTWPSGLTLNPTTGAVSTTTALAPGTYTVAYSLCDKGAPPNCATASATVTVAASIRPTADSGSAVAGTASMPVTNVAINDHVNGALATLGSSGNATVAVSGTWPAGITLNVATGAINTSVAVAPGTHLVQYTLCDRSVPANCATAAVSVKVSASVVPVTASGTAVVGTPSTAIGDVAANGTINGAPATLGPSGNATVAESGAWPPGIALNPITGAVTTNASTASGTYQLGYQLCDRSAPPVCALMTDKVTVTPTATGQLLLAKSADKLQATVGDNVLYHLQVRNTAGGTIGGVEVRDSLPLGFQLISGTALIATEPASPTKSQDPAGAPGPELSWILGNLSPGQVVDIYYHVRLGVGADRGDGINRAQAVGGGTSSSVATAQVLVTGGPFASEACVVGKIYVDCNGNRVKDRGEPGIPGVRLYFEDGTNVISDENGNFSVCGLRPVTHALKVDPISLPAGSRLVVLSNRNAGDGNSLFVDLRDGELHRADFAEGSCTNKVMEDVEQRRARGPVLAPFPAAGSEHLGIEFESKSAARPEPGASPPAPSAAPDGGDGP